MAHFGPQLHPCSHGPAPVECRTKPGIEQRVRCTLRASLLRDREGDDARDDRQDRDRSVHSAIHGRSRSNATPPARANIATQHAITIPRQTIIRRPCGWRASVAN